MTEILIGRNDRASLSIGSRHGGRTGATANVRKALSSRKTLRDIPGMLGHAVPGLIGRMVGGRR